MDSEQNLLFGVLALRLERISAEQFAEVCITWSTRRDRPRLPDLIVERGWMDASEREEIERQMGSMGVGDTLRLPGILPLPAGRSEGAPTLGEIEVPGARAGRYTIRQFHGEGGAARIYVALDHVLNREVALKEVKPELSHQSETRRRLLREVQITGQLEHPSIVPIYDLARGPEDDAPFYTMRLLRGQTLQDAFADYHRRRKAGTVDPLELPRLIHALISICNAVGYAHSRGVIHRDLKPENAVIGKFGVVVLLDWGLAKLIAAPHGQEEGEFVDLTADASLQDTVTGIAVGTPAYMAPEQVGGRQDRVDLRTDIYGLGAILFELLTGRAPHVGDDSAEVLVGITSDPTPRARDVDSSVPPALDAVCARAMCKHIEDRYADASQVADELERYLADEPVRAYRGGWVHRAGLWARRNPAWSRAAAAALFISIAVTSTAAIWLANMAGQERRARMQGLLVAAKFGAEIIANETALRRQHLGEEAADPDLLAHIRALRSAEDLQDYPDLGDLEDWLVSRHRRYAGLADATSWFLTDHEGRQLARSPPQPDILGKNFAYRDYFHARGEDYQEGTAASPIQDFHRSIAFRSKATENLIVAFTTPIWDGEKPDRQVLGVLGMTVELGSFAGLQTNLGDDQLVVLVETKRYRIDEEEGAGLVLHHPGLAESSGGQQIFRLDPDQIDRLRMLTQLELGRRARLNLVSPEEKNALGRLEPLLGAMETNYRDAVGGRFEGEWLAAFAPVIVNTGSDALDGSGWIVIVQERKD